MSDISPAVKVKARLRIPRSTFPFQQLSLLMRQHSDYDSDATPSSEVVERYRRARETDDSTVSLALVSYRGTETEYELGLLYIASEDPVDRSVGAEVLAQLGWSDQAFREESINALLPLLDDPNEEVVYSAAVALGHRRAEKAIPRLLELADHPSSEIRYGVTMGLLGLEDERAIAALIRLSRDSDRDVRNWATFGLGSLIETDSPDIRSCLKERLSDSDHEIRGEALVGLAERGEHSVVQALQAEWLTDSVSVLSLEAAALAESPILLPQLIEIQDTIDTSDDLHFATVLADAISACARKAEPENCG